jgi:hypothetical protein
MVDQAEIALHFVWPNPLSNRFSDIQLHPSFWSGTVFAGAAALTRGTGNLSAVGREAAVLVESTHTVVNNAGLQATIFFSNMLVAGFRDVANFGNLAAGLHQSNGRAFIIVGDGLFEVNGFAMNNERNAGTNLWASSGGSKFSLRIKSAILNYTPSADVSAFANLDQC